MPKKGEKEETNDKMKVINLTGDVLSWEHPVSRAVFEFLSFCVAPSLNWGALPPPFTESYVNSSASERCLVVECMTLLCTYPVGLLRKTKGRNSHPVFSSHVSMHNRKKSVSPGCS